MVKRKHTEPRSLWHLTTYQCLSPQFHPCQEVATAAMESLPSSEVRIWHLSAVIRHYFCSYFSSIFDPTSLHFLYPTFLPSCLPLLCLFLFLFLCFHAHEQTTRTPFNWYNGHRTTCLLGYRHSETVLLWFPLTRILRGNLFCRHRTLPPLKVPDFPDTEHE